MFNLHLKVICDNFAIPSFNPVNFDVNLTKQNLYHF